MQKAYFPMETLRLTQGRNVGSHRGTMAGDFGGRDGGRDRVFAPCDMRIIRVRADSRTNGEVYAQSTGPVLLPDGRESMVHFTFIHDDVFNANCRQGAVIAQGTYFYDEGGRSAGKPGVYASHLHLEAGLGPSPAYQARNEFGCWSTPHDSALEQIFWLRPDTQVINGGGLAWKRDEPEQEEEKMQFYSVKQGKAACQIFNSQSVDDVSGTLKAGINYPLIGDLGQRGGYHWLMIYAAGACKYAVLLDDRAELLPAMAYNAEQIAATIRDQTPAQISVDTAAQTQLRQMTAERDKLLTAVHAAKAALEV